MAALAAKYAVAALLCLFFCFPYLYMLNKSLMTVQQAAEGSSFWTRSFELRNFGIVGQYLKNIGNTLQVVCINGFFVPFTALFCAFPIARMRFAGKKIVFAVIMATVMIPNTVLMVPTYILFVKFGFVDKLVSQWIGSFWGGGALNIFLAVQFMRSIPKEIDNAAKIDGANWFQIYFGMIFPLCFNIFLYICISTVMGLWMDFQGPLIKIAEIGINAVSPALILFLRIDFIVPVVCIHGVNGYLTISPAHRPGGVNQLSRPLFRKLRLVQISIFIFYHRASAGNEHIGPQFLDEGPGISLSSGCADAGQDALFPALLQRPEGCPGNLFIASKQCSIQIK